MKKLYKIVYKVNGVKKVNKMMGENENEIKTFLTRDNKNYTVSDIDIKEINITERLAYICQHNEDIRERILRRQKETVEQQLALVKYTYFLTKMKQNPNLKVYKVAIGYCQETVMVKRAEEAVKVFFLKNPHLTDEVADIHIKEVVVNEQIKTIHYLLQKIEDKNQNDLTLLLQNEIKEVELLKFKMEIERINTK